MADDCLFCRIIKGEIPASKIYEDKDVVAFLDIFPVQKGHTIVIPVDHYETILDFPDDRMQKYFSTLKKLAGRIKGRLNADGINILQNNFPAAGQVVLHMHYHIIPRWGKEADPFIRQPKEQASPQYLNEVVKALGS